MSNRIAETIERGLRAEGLNIVARFEPAPDLAEDPEIALFTWSGDGIYPISVRLIGISHASVCVRAHDGSGEVSAISRSRTRPLSDMTGIVDLVAALIRDRAPVPCELRTPVVA